MVNSERPSTPAEIVNGLRESRSDIETALAALANARSRGRDLLKNPTIPNDPMTAAAVIDFITSERWRTKGDFTQRVVKNMAELLSPGQPFVIVDKDRPYIFVAGDVPAEKFLNPNLQVVDDEIARASIGYQGNTGSSFMIADTHPGITRPTSMRELRHRTDDLFGAPDSKPSYLPEANKMRTFFGASQIQAIDGGAETRTQILVNHEETIVALFQQSLLVASGKEAPEGIFKSVESNIAVLKRVVDDPGFLSRAASMSEKDKNATVENLVEYLSKLELSYRSGATPGTARGLSYMHNKLPGIGGFDQAIGLFPEMDIRERVLKKVGVYEGHKRRASYAGEQARRSRLLK